MCGTYVFRAGDERAHTHSHTAAAAAAVGFTARSENHGKNKMKNRAYTATVHPGRGRVAERTRKTFNFMFTQRTSTSVLTCESLYATDFVFLNFCYSKGFVRDPVIMLVGGSS